MKKIFFILFVFVLFSCKVKSPYQFTKVKNGNIPYHANTLIISEQDTLWASFRHPKRYGGFKQKYNGKFYHFTSGPEHRVRFSCDLKDGKLNGDAYYYYSNDSLLSISYLKNGVYDGYKFFYYSNGIIQEIKCYCNFKKVGIWSYYDDNGDLLFAKNYGDIPDSCQIPNQYLYDSLPEKYKIKKIDSLVFCCVIRNYSLSTILIDSILYNNDDPFVLAKDTNHTVFLYSKSIENNDNLINKTFFVFEVENKFIEEFEFDNNEILKAKAMYVSINGNNLNTDSIICFSNECYIKGEKIKYDIWNIDVNIKLKQSESANYIEFNKKLKYYICEKEDNDYVPLLW